MPEASHTERAVIVGANGFIGRSLTNRLRTDAVEVAEFTRRSPVVPRGDRWEEVLGSTTVFWAASTINPAIAAAHPELVASDHERFRGFLKALSDDGSSTRVVLLSSGGTVYGDGGSPPFTETSPTRPLSAYGEAKVALERELASHALGGVAARIANAYGPGQHPAPGQGVIGHWLRALAAREPIRIIGDARTVRDYIYIDDLTDALTRIHRLPSDPPPALNLGSGNPTTLEDILRVIETVSHAHPAMVEASPARSFDVGAVWLDTSLAQETIDWQATTSLPAGIQKMWTWIRTQMS